MDRVRREIERFEPEIPIERAVTPPASWYLDPEILELERKTVFRRSWQAVARRDQLSRPGDYVSGELVGEPWVVVRDDAGELRAFFNVCRHHATCVASGAGRTRQLVCPYHGWTYDLDGRLRKAPRMAGVEAFDRERLGLVPMDVASWGPLVYVRLGSAMEGLDQLMRPVDGRMKCGSLRFVARRSWEIRCNWKVFVDNYLDGGYHVSHLHRGLASLLDLDSYRTEIDGRVSLQICSAGDDDAATDDDFGERVGEGAVYAFVYPNLMLNRYGPILDTNFVVPLAVDRTLTVFDYFFEPATADADPAFVERSLEASAKVQQEDIDVCESVQRGLGSSAYDVGRYAPRVEQAAHHFHAMLSRDLRTGSD